MIETVMAAATLGFIGTGHCALMCGPLATAGCRGRRETIGYFVGRGTAHAFVGALLGAFGASLPEPARVVTTVVVGVVMVGVGIVRLLPRAPLVRLPSSRGRWWSDLASLLPGRGLGLGLVTGGLPCGLLTAAWMLAASTGHPVLGAVSMGVFSVASAPGLVAPLFLIRRFGPPPARLAAFAWMAAGVWVAARPLLMSHHGGH